MQLKNTLIAGAAVLAMASCQQSGTKNTEAQGRKLLDPANMDTTVHPGDNFFQYANGTWLKKNPIPASKSRWGSFNELQENNYTALHQLLDSAASVANPAAGSTIQKVGDFYRTGMDSTTIDKVGITPLNEYINRINNVKTKDELVAEITLEHTQGAGTVFSFGISPDDKNVSKEICQFGQGGLGMPGKEYYFDKDERTAKIREAYQQYIPKMLELMGDDKVTAEKEGKDIYELELKLAGASMTRVEMRDPYKLYNKFNIDGINKLTPGLDWKVLLTQSEGNRPGFSYRRYA